MKGKFTFLNTLKGNCCCYFEKVSKWEFDTQITPRLHLFVTNKIAYINTTTMLGPVFNHDTLHLIIIAFYVYFVVNVNAN